jgi:hypothetical protein
MRVMQRMLALGCGGLLLFACSASGAPDALDDDASSTAGTGGSGVGPGVGGSSFNTTSGAGAAGPDDDCSEAAKLIYVLSDGNVLYSFKPDEKKLTMIGPLACPTTMSPNSMAIDRDAVAWVNYVQPGVFGDDGGAIFKVNTLDASCESAPVVTLPNGWYRIGMGFSSDGANTADETLFITSIGFAGALGYVNASNQAQAIGNFSGSIAGQSAELTGTGDGRLYGFFTSSPVVVAEIEKTNAAPLNAKSLATLPVPNAWAFSFWGGDFYLYTANIGNSRVSRYRPSDDSVDTTYIADVGFRIIGAGVSTCAPLEPPK